jgi:HK97 family phage major capsid protein
VYFGGDESNATGEIVAGFDTAVTQDTISTYQITITPQQFSSKYVPVSLSMLGNQASNITDYLTTSLANRVGRIQNTTWTTGASVGITTQCSVGKTTASATAITFAEWLDLTASVDYIYQADKANCTLMCNQTTLRLLKGLTTDYGVPLYSCLNVGANLGESFDGFGIQVNNAMANPTTGNKAAAFGNFKSAYVIADYLGGGQLYRLQDSNSMKVFSVFFLYGQVTGGNVVNSSAVKLLRMNAGS